MLVLLRRCVWSSFQRMPADDAPSADSLWSLPVSPPRLSSAEAEGLPWRRGCYPIQPTCFPMFSAATYNRIVAVDDIVSVAVGDVEIPVSAA